jgi:hypothetical protein
MDELPDGYVLKNGAPGYFVDGYCGYLVAGYYDTADEAISRALWAIQEAQARGEKYGYPVWYAWYTKDVR